MATLALSAVGSALGASLLPAGLTLFGATITGAAIGQAVGATLGSVIDNTLLAPTQKVEGQRLSDVTLTRAAHGTVFPRVWGTAAVPGAVIWATNLRETANTTTSGGKGGGPRVETTTYAYAASFALALADGPMDGLGRLWANGAPLDLSPLAYRVYQGSETQLPDPIIEAVEGAAPAYRGLSYLVFEDMDLGGFGNRLPQLRAEITRALPAEGLEGILQAMAADYGVGVQTAGIGARGVTGLALQQITSFRATLDILARAFQLNVFEADGLIRIEAQSADAQAEVTLEELARQGNAAPLRRLRAPPRDLPSGRGVSFRDASRDYTVMKVIEGHHGGAGGSDEIALPVVTDRTTGLNVARRTLAGDLAAVDRAQFTLPPTHIARTVGDVLDLDGARFRIDRLETGLDLRCEAVAVTPAAYLDHVAPDAPGFAAAAEPGPTDLAVIAGVVLTSDDLQPHQPYLAAAGDPWQGLALYRLEAGEWVRFADLPLAAAMGVLTAPLPMGTAPDPDVINTLSVQMDRGTLVGVDPADLDIPRLNAMAVERAGGDWEILQFATATLTGAGTYDLTHLKRALRGTAQGAPDGARVVLLDAARLAKLPIRQEETGMTFTYRHGPRKLPPTDPRFTEFTLTA